MIEIIDLLYCIENALHNSLEKGVKLGLCDVLKTGLRPRKDVIRSGRLQD